MEHEHIPNDHEKAPDLELITPAAESLLHFEDQHSAWPEEIRNNPELQQQALLRRELYTTLEKIFDYSASENTELQEAVELKKVRSEDASNAYEKLVQLLESDEAASRISLYLPFEILPAQSWKPESATLAEATTHFRNVYIQKWYDLLSVNDVRANFIDGDVLETELREKPLERVVKAAHLIPKMMEKGLLNLENIVELVHDNPDSPVQKSIIETLPVLVDMNLISQSEYEKILSENNIKEDTQNKKEKNSQKEYITEARATWIAATEKEKADGPLYKKEGVKIPELDASFSKQAEGIKDQAKILDEMIISIEQHEVLSEYIYPMSLVFGSRLKGYALPDADLDYAVFIKPGTPIEKRSEIQELLRQTLEGKISGKPVEFWLEEKEGALGVKDFPNPDRMLGDSSWAHVLFEGAWYGTQDSIKELHEKLLSGYLYSKDKKIKGRDARGIWLEEMEKDILQYRLMHKGYARYFPQQGGMHTEHSHLIDGESMFYDSGYRRVATKLFLQKVFLPQLES